MKQFFARMSPILLIVGLAALPAGQASAAPNPTGPGVTINDATALCGAQSAATPYPSTITLAGLATVTDVNVTLTGLSHEYQDDLGVLLVGPQNQTALLMSAVGGNTTSAAVDYTFDDAAANQIADAGPVATGTYQPSSASPFCGIEDFVSPAPAGPYGSSLAGFNGTDPNGTWSLYIVDRVGYDSGSLTSWSLNITAPDTTAPTTTIALTPPAPNGTNAWYNTPIPITVSAVDNTGGSGVAETRCDVRLSTDPAPATFDDIPAGCRFTGAGATEFTNKNFVMYAASKDNDGNKETPVSSAFKLDSRDPNMTCSVSPKKLTPANHTLRTVTATVNVTDVTSGVTGFTLLSVTSNQADSGLGAGDVALDRQGWASGTADTSGQLRAEKFGHTRVYTLTYGATDSAGNAETCKATVRVP